MPARWLVPEIGLRDTRRGRRWIAVFRILSDAGGAQETIEATTWTALLALDARRKGEERIRRVTAALESLGLTEEDTERVAKIVQRAYDEVA